MLVSKKFTRQQSTDSSAAQAGMAPPALLQRKD